MTTCLTSYLAFVMQEQMTATRQRNYVLISYMTSLKLPIVTERLKAYIRLFGEWLVTFMPIFQIIGENVRKLFMKVIRKKFCLEWQ